MTLEEIEKAVDDALAIDSYKSTKDQLIKRLKSFVWRAGAMTILALSAYLVNISSIQDIDWDKLATIAVVTVSGLIVSEITKYLNSRQ